MVMESAEVVCQQAQAKSGMQQPIGTLVDNQTVAILTVTGRFFKDLRNSFYKEGYASNHQN